jgi:hypothetical protein
VYGQTYGQNPYQPVGQYAAQPVYGQPGYVQAQANRFAQGVPVPVNYGGYRKRKSAKSKAKAKRKRGSKRKTHRRRRQ